MVLLVYFNKPTNKGSTMAQMVRMLGWRLASSVQDLSAAMGKDELPFFVPAPYWVSPDNGDVTG